MLTKFATTPLMSSYLVAIFVGNYSYLEGNTGRGLRVRTYAPYELLDETHWALEVAIKAMDTYEKIYKIPYPLKKLGRLRMFPLFDSASFRHDLCSRLRGGSHGKLGLSDL